MPATREMRGWDEATGKRPEAVAPLSAEAERAGYEFPPPRMTDSVLRVSDL
jgi:hypothetical protein